MSGAVVSLEKHQLWYNNIRENLSGLQIINYWTNNWIPDKSRLSEGDTIYFRLGGVEVARGSYMFSKKQTVEKAFYDYGISNGIKQNQTHSPEEFLYLINKSIGKKELNSIIGCILIKDLIVFKKPVSMNLKNKTVTRIMYI
ncbi:hypothetical protein [Paenibacillus camelliae]|uniref:hypothetical protein n=1 Tax=Paenibacillus camelliae TaxID=512410 RepID=UPI00203D857D|nr:hypothetical protein [Paenibacillus camelliae]MCM3634262.1 hypothetical protein [Paenibacillus camelliae]